MALRYLKNALGHSLNKKALPVLEKINKETDNKKIKERTKQAIKFIKQGKEDHWH